jgi:hypothetical protein
LKSQLHYLHVVKDGKPQARRALLASASEELIKVIVEGAINTLNGNLKLSTEESINSVNIRATYVRWLTRKSVLKVSVNFRFKEVD